MEEKEILNVRINEEQYFPESEIVILTDEEFGCLQDILEFVVGNDLFDDEYKKKSRRNL